MHPLTEWSTTRLLICSSGDVIAQSAHAVAPCGRRLDTEVGTHYQLGGDAAGAGADDA